MCEAGEKWKEELELRSESKDGLPFETGQGG